jgi:hypothetical protein
MNLKVALRVMLSLAHVVRLRSEADTFCPVIRSHDYSYKSACLRPDLAFGKR